MTELTLKNYIIDNDWLKKHTDAQTSYVTFNKNLLTVSKNSFFEQKNNQTDLNCRQPEVFHFKFVS